jgi:cell division protein FtsI/penicillin-binding protein 2
VVAAVAPAAGPREATAAQVLARPVSAATARQLERMLEAVVTDGTGRAAAIPGYRVAGKTGTAQKADPGGRGYSSSRYVASFVGFAPARRPALVAAVIIDEPWPLYHGGQVAAPVFARIIEPALLYLGIPPTPEEEDADGEDAPLPAPPTPVVAAAAAAVPARAPGGPA